MFLWVAHLRGTPKRYFHASVSVGHRLFSFGGFCRERTDHDECSGDRIGVYVFNTVSLLWAKLPPSRSSLEVPPARCCHTAALIGDAVYIWGGIVNIEMEEEDGRSATIQGEYCGALYAFEVVTHAWSKPGGVSGTPPRERLGHSACVLGTVMYIYGGFNHLSGYTDDIHTLDTATMVWARRSAVRGTPPPASLYHSATVVGTRILVFGGLSGSDQRTHCDGVAVLDTESDRWLSPVTRQQPSSAWQPRRPEGRRCHSAFAYRGELFVCGGITFDRSFNDCWKLDPETFCWRRVEATAGCGSGTFTMCCCLVGAHTVLFEEDTSDDLYVLDLDPALKTLCKLAVIGHGLERSGLPHDVRWELAAMTTTSNG